MNFFLLKKAIRQHWNFKSMSEINQVGFGITFSENTCLIRSRNISSYSSYCITKFDMSFCGSYKLCLRSRQELCYVRLMIIMTDKMKQYVNSSVYYWNIIKCRQLIYENKDLIAFPKAEFASDNYEIHVLVPKYETDFEEFDLKLKQINLVKLCTETLITNQVYEMALSYTIKTRIAPYWNSVQDYFVKGRNFLTIKDELNCIKLTVSIDEFDVAFLDLKPFNTFFLRKKIDEFNLIDEVIDNFKSGKSNLIIPIGMDDRKVRLLPNLHKGRILSIVRNVAENTEFNSYDQLRRYWKNLYGYRLPESEDDIVFYNIQFSNQDQIFTYPDVCAVYVIAKNYNCTDKKVNVMDFIICIEEKLSMILKKKTKIYRNFDKKFNTQNDKVEVDYDVNNNEI